ncbi:MAG: lycopene cyclase domain-containing protein [Calditrichota bacterium]
MKSEYLIFNLIVFSGPFALSFDKKVHFYRKWKQAFIAISIPLIPFVIWDALVTHRHWWFNTEYTLDMRIANLPPGEWLFFITVPYACIFTWEVFVCYNIGNERLRWNLAPFLMLLFIPGIAFFAFGKEYTGLVLIALTFATLLDKRLGTSIWQKKRILLFLALCTVFMLIFNGYLTARPVVLYGVEYQLDFRIFTIPVEDFGYGFALLLSNIILFEKLKAVQHG